MLRVGVFKCYHVSYSADLYTVLQDIRRVPNAKQIWNFMTQISLANSKSVWPFALAEKQLCLSLYVKKWETHLWVICIQDTSLTFPFPPHGNQTQTLILTWWDIQVILFLRLCFSDERKNNQVFLWCHTVIILLKYAHHIHTSSKAGQDFAVLHWETWHGGGRLCKSNFKHGWWICQNKRQIALYQWR